MNNLTVPSPGKIFQWLVDSRNEIVVTVWACTSFYIMYVSRGQNESLLFAPLALGAVVLVWMTYNKPVIAKVDPLLSVGVFTLIFSILASYLFNSQRYEVVFMAGNVVSALLMFVSLYAITTKINLDFRKTLVLVCIFCSPLLPVIISTSILIWGRLVPMDLHPNYVSMMALLCFIGACSVRSFWVGLILCAVPLYAIVLMQSRDSLLSAVIAVVIIGGYRIRRLQWKTQAAFLVTGVICLPILSIGLYFMGYNVFASFNDVFESLFMLNDEHRGFSSGGSGRTDLWTAAINLWLSHPLFGVGFKGHSMMMPDNMVAHNAYLAMLADVGLFGFFSYMLIVCVTLYRTFKRGQRGLSEYPQRLVILITYILYGLLEARAFSFGNTYSVLFFLVAFDSCKLPVESRAALKLPALKPSSTSREPEESRVDKEVVWLRSGRVRRPENGR